MWIRDEIAASIARLAADAVALGTNETLAAEQLIERAFATRGTRALWERLNDGASIYDPNAWRRIPDFVRTPALLLAQDVRGRCGFRFEAPAELTDVLDDCSGFEFYVTDGQGKYVIAFNDHDVLIGCGDAAPWVRSLDARTTK